MAITYHFEAEGELLKVFASGASQRLEEVLEYMQAVILEAVANNSRKVLCDERQLSHDLGVADTVSLAKKTRETAPGVGRVAIVYNEKELNTADFYKTVTSNRGLFIYIATTYEEAMNWLNKT